MVTNCHKEYCKFLSSKSKDYFQPHKNALARKTFIACIIHFFLASKLKLSQSIA